MRKALLATLLIVAMAAGPAQLLAQNTNKAVVPKKSTAAEPAVKKSRAIPFSGNLKAVDKTAKTITVDKRTFQITAETKILKADKPASLENGVAGEYVTGSYTKSDDGKLLAHSIYFGGKTKAKGAEKKQ